MRRSMASAGSYSVVCMLAAAMLLYSMLSSAGANAATSAVVADERMREIATHRVWLTLLHHEPSLIGAATHSAINGSEFFLSDTGASDLLAELEATLEALRENTHEVQCRFPARFIWLRKQIALARDLPKKECTEYRDWQPIRLVQSVWFLPPGT